jgi:DtxR family Mn-dependent transcriptional regulator
VKARLAGESGKATTSVVEDYLQLMHYLTRDGCTVIAARIAERLNVSPPTVTATLQRMQRDGLIEHGPHKEILFTPQGRLAAEDIVRRHALAERLLTDLLKMPWHESHEEAQGVEHVMTPAIEAHLLQVLGNPTTCPHGNPIPGLGTLEPDEFPLAEARTGDELRIQRITEEAEEDPQLMKYLQQHGVQPGARMRVREATDFNATLVLEGPHGLVSLGLGVAGKLRARRIE